MAAPTAAPPAPAAPAPTPATPADGTRFFGSQIGGKSVINYSYTDNPWTLMGWDIYYFFQFFWAIPYLLWPVTPTDSGELSELSLTSGNIFCIAVHVVLCILQLGFLAVLPTLVALPVWTAIAAVALFMLLNKGICTFLNGKGVEYHSDPKYAPALPEHAHEQWIYINGVAAGEHWMQTNLNRLAVTFKRPILGVHNKTSGILFDVIECLIQRNWGYATTDVRVGYRIIKKKLYNPRYSKIIFILHSQGGIEGGLILDWLLQELPQDLLSKLEVYTFGNAANHFNNPHRHIRTQGLAMLNPLAASIDSTRLPNYSPNPSSSPSATPVPVPTPALTDATTTPNPSSISDRAIGHIEHYAHTTDFVALWGVLHFATSAPASQMLPRFLGRVFVRTSPRGGHQFVQHYLDGMFPLKRDKVTGELVRGKDGVPWGCEEEGNAFMEGEVLLEGREGGDGGNGGDSGSDEEGDVEVIGVSPVSPVVGGGFGGEEGEEVRVKVKALSRLWQYRNGKSPHETPPSLVLGGDGVVRNSTM